MRQRFQHFRRARERGVLLLSALLLMIIIFGISGSLLTYAMTDAREARESTESAAAFYLAESGLEAAKWELSTAQDPDANGLGVKDVTSTTGSYLVAVVDLGSGFYQLTSTGSSGASSVALREIVGPANATAFPPGAMSVVGNVNDVDIFIEKDRDLIMDGGSSPALSFSDAALYNRIGSEFASAVNGGSLPVGNITGTPTNTFGTPAVDLPIVHQPQYSDSLKDLAALYTEFVTRVNALRPTATVVGPTFNSTYGSPASPVTIYAPDLNTITNQTITGYGALIIGDHLKLASNAILNWTGDVFVIGDSTKDAELELNGGTLNVTGNVVVLGEGSLDTEFEVNSGGTATIDGSLFFGTDWTNPAGPKSELDVNNGGSLTVNGLVTMVGPEVKMEFSDPSSNPSNRVAINGMLQVAVPDSPSVGTMLELELEGNVEIHKDDAAIQRGADALSDLGIQYAVPTQQLIESSIMETFSWRRLPGS